MSDALSVRTALVRLAGFSIWFAVAGFLPFCSDPLASPTLTVLALAAFGGLFWLGTRPTLTKPRWLLILGLLGQTLASLILALFHPYFLMSGLLVVVGWQAALLLPVGVALAWIVSQTLLCGLLLSHALPLALLAASMASCIGFQSFALAAAALTRAERSTRLSLDEALQALADAQENRLRRERQEERLRIARDLHDELGHGLTALGMIAASVTPEADETKCRATLDLVRNQSRDLLVRLREVVSDMRETVDGSVDIERALRSFCEGYFGPLTLDLVVEGDFSGLGKPYGLALLRLVQEAVTNTLRHAGTTATRILISLTRQGAQCRLRVSDDGKGTADFGFGNGLAGMSERIAALGGTLSAEGGLGRGFTVEARLPMTGS